MKVDAKKLLAGPSTIGTVLKKVRGSLPQEDFAHKHGLRASTLRNWEQGRALPRLEQAFSLIRALGYDGLKELGYDLGDLLDAPRGDPGGTRHESHHWLDEILKEAPATVKEKIIRELRDLGGKYGKR